MAVPDNASATTMNPAERRAAFGLAGVYGFRMLGLFLILPVFALHAETLPGSTPVLTGLAIGIYGLTQALLQIPFGRLSDRIGRKPVIIAGLLLFALGSVVAAMAEDIWLILVGRALQGSGAIAAAVMALAADLTRDSQRTKAMALIGMTIGAAFMLSLVSGPMLAGWIGVNGIFWLTALLAISGMGLILLVVPNPAGPGVSAQPVSLSRVLRMPDLLRLDLGILILHLILTALFLVVPLSLRDAGLPMEQHSYLYLPVLVMSLLLMVPFIVLAERKGKMKSVFLGAIALLGVAQLGLYCFVTQFWGIVLSLLLFFWAFNLLEATLPSLVSKLAPVVARGTAMGVYSTSQFAGAFLGGALGGVVHAHFGSSVVFLMGASLTLIWLAVAATMNMPVSQ